MLYKLFLDIISTDREQWITITRSQATIEEMKALARTIVSNKEYCLDCYIMRIYYIDKNGMKNVLFAFESKK
jgi:hypothetical protein